MWFLQKETTACAVLGNTSHTLTAIVLCLGWSPHKFSFLHISMSIGVTCLQLVFRQLTRLLSVALQILLGGGSPIAKFLFLSLKSLPTSSAMSLEPKCRSFVVDVSVGDR